MAALSGRDSADLEQSSEVRDVEYRAQCLVDAGESDIGSVLADMLAQLDQHAQACAVHVVGAAQIDGDAGSLRKLLVGLTEFAIDVEYEVAVDRDDGGMVFPGDADSLHAFLLSHCSSASVALLLGVPPGQPSFLSSRLWS
jgi:hypothetical protein